MLFSRSSSPPASKLAPVLLALLAATGACGGDSSAPGSATDDRPNLLWIVWDTVRADRTSLHGHERDTTPFLAAWARDARVFDECRSTAPNTTPSHASMFTGLFPTEHGADNRPSPLAPGFETFAERAHAGGYRTFLWSANPHVARTHGLGQGFETELHPWSSGWEERALAIARTNAPDAANPGLHATGELANEALLDWLELGQRDVEARERPWFAFVNLMEAHRPYRPRAEHMARLGGPDAAAAYSALDDGFTRMRTFNLGVSEYTAEELELVGLAYDASLLRLDELFAELIAELDARGALEDTIVVVTSDHGEHLGEHHLLDHQYSVYEELLRVPLVVRAPGRLTPGREPAPVQGLDLFPTLLEFCDLGEAQRADPLARSLAEPAADRKSLAELFSPPQSWIKELEAQYPQLDAKRFGRDLHAWVDGDWKLIRAEGGGKQVFDLGGEGEARNLAGEEPERRGALAKELRGVLKRFVSAPRVRAPRAPAKDRERLEALGYAGE